MIGLIMKLIVCPLTLIICKYIFGLHYTIAQGIFIGVVLAFAAHVLELFILKRGTLWISTLADLIAAFSIIYLSQFLLNNVSITVLGAIFTAALITVFEYLEHYYLIRSGKTKKTED